MASNFVNVNTIASESLMQLENELVALRLAYRDKTADFGKVGGYAVGESVTVKTRPAYETDEFSGTIQTQDIRQSSTTFAIEKLLDISIPWTSREASMSIDSLSEDVIIPAMQSLAQKLDTHLLSKAWEGRGQYFSANLLQNSADIALARREANRQQMPRAGRIGLVNGDIEAAMLGTDAFNRFDARESAGVDALTNANLGRLMGIDWMSSENFTDETHTPGDGTTSTVASPTATENVIGATALTVAATSGTFEAGDRIYVAGMYRPMIVASQVNAGATSIPLSHQIDEIVPASAAVTVVSTGATATAKSGIIFTPDAFAYAMPPLDLPGDKVAAVMSANGMSIRVVQGYNQETKTNTMSFDCLIGAKCYDPRKVTVLGKY